MANLNQFLANLGVTGFAKPNRFEVFIIPPSKNYTELSSQGLLRHMTLVCEAVEIPSQTISTAELRLNGLPIIPIPYEFSYTNTLNLTFKLSEDYRERNMLLAWQDNVYRPGKGFSFYNDYTGTIIVRSLNSANTPIQEIIFRNCFPTSVNDIQYNWASNNEYLRQMASFSFFTMETQSLSIRRSYSAYADGSGIRPDGRPD